MAKRAAGAPTVTTRAIAALFLERQHLVRPRARRFSPKRLTAFLEDVGGLQLDSINVLDRAHYLTTWARFGPYDRAALDRLAYRRRLAFEYWGHAACLLPASHLVWWRRAMLDYEFRHTGWTSWLRKNKKTIALVEEAIRTRGPLGNADFARRTPGSGAGWWDWKPATHALHYLFMTGRIAIHSRVHFHKRYDLAERVLPATAAAARDEFARWHVERSLHAMGAATEADLRQYLSFPRFERGARRRVLAELLKRGRVVELAGAGGRDQWYALADDVPALATAGRRRVASQGTTLLAPFDSFLWHRQRTERLFGFEYRIEVYTPSPKRVHGYYTLPILHDGQLIGRLDAKNHRGAGRLEVRNVHFEPWFVSGATPPAASWGPVDRDRAFAGVAEAVRSLAEFCGARDITLGRTDPRALAPALRAAIEKTPASKTASQLASATKEA